MARSSLAALLAVALAAVAAGCGGGDGGRAAEAHPPLAGAEARASAAPTAGALARIADGRAARERLAYVNVAALRRARLPVPAAEVRVRVLGAGDARVRTVDPDAVTTAVQVGSDVSVLRGPGVGAVAGRRSGRDGVIVGARGALAARLADATPERSAITPSAPSAVQSCLGDTLAQTILGPGTMGADAALGVGLARSADPPAGIQLRICGAPHLVRHVHAMERALEARFGRGSEAPERAPRIGEQEIGEREIVAGVVAAGDVPAGDLLAMLEGGPALRALAWR